MTFEKGERSTRRDEKAPGFTSAAAPKRLLEVFA
jgi:hypothetical protein